MGIFWLSVFKCDHSLSSASSEAAESAYRSVLLETLYPICLYENVNSHPSSKSDVVSSSPTRQPLCSFSLVPNSLSTPSLLLVHSGFCN